RLYGGLCLPKILRSRLMSMSPLKMTEASMCDRAYVVTACIGFAAWCTCHTVCSANGIPDWLTHAPLLHVSQAPHALAGHGIIQAPALHSRPLLQEPGSHVHTTGSLPDSHTPLWHVSCPTTQSASVAQPQADG